MTKSIITDPIGAAIVAVITGVIGASVGFAANQFFSDDAGTQAFYSDDAQTQNFLSGE